MATALVPWHPACSSRGGVRGPRRWAVAPGTGGKTTGTPAMAQRPSRSSGHGPAIALAVPGKDGVQLPDPLGAQAWRSPAPPRDVGFAGAPSPSRRPTSLRAGRSFDRGRGGYDMDRMLSLVVVAALALAAFV